MDTHTHTHQHAHTYTYRHPYGKSFKKPGTPAIGRHAPGLNRGIEIESEKYATKLGIKWYGNRFKI